METTMDGSPRLSPETPPRFDSIDSFRGLAAVAVVFSHTWSGLKAAHFASANTVIENAGALLSYLFRGSSTYFMVITGFILAAKLPAWQKDPNGLILRASQRITKIVIIYWIALVLIMIINAIKGTFFGTAWFKPDLLNISAQFLFFSNYLKEPHNYLAASWYLEADFVIFISLISCYFIWIKLPGHLQQRLRPIIFISTIAVVYCCLLIESEGQFERGLNAPIRLLTYFILGFLAWHAKTYVSAMLALICNSILILIVNDLTALHKFLYTSNAAILAFIFYSSHYSKTIAILVRQPIIVKIYKINFCLFLFNLFFIMIGVSAARHFAPHSVPGLIAILLISMLGLLIFSYYFTKYIQQPALAWHDAAWKRMLTQVSSRKQGQNEASPKKDEALITPEPVRADMA